MVEKEVYGVIYLVKNKKNNKVYVGQTSQIGGFDRRYRNNVYKYTNNIYLKRSIEKYGINEFELIKEYEKAYDKKDLDEKEIKYIELFKANDPKYGYNIKGGGSFGKLAESTKQKLREVNLGKRYSSEINQKKTRIGKDNGMFGRRHSRESINKMSENRKDKYKGIESGRAVRVQCITTGKIFDCIREAGEYYGIKSYTHISRVCNDELRFCGRLPDETKLEWKYIDNIFYSNEEIGNRKSGALKRAKKVLCKTTNKVFNSQREAGEYYGIKYFRHISEVCNGHSMSCGKLSDGTKLTWKYLDK